MKKTKTCFVCNAKFENIKNTMGMMYLLDETEMEKLDNAYNLIHIDGTPDKFYDEEDAINLPDMLDCVCVCSDCMLKAIK